MFGSFPVPVAGKTGTAEKVVQLPGYPVDHTEDQSWWCGYGPAQTEVARLVVCAVIENGGHGGTAASPAHRWLFAEGSQGFFDTYVLVTNANAGHTLPTSDVERYLIVRLDAN